MIHIDDAELQAVIAAEENRQNENLEMIASESVQSAGMLAVAGCCFNNKTAVGRPGYQRLLGAGVTDELERLAARRACEVFGAEHANMTPYSGSVANYCAYAAVLKPGDRALAMDPAIGAHQTHGDKRNISSKIYQFEYYGLHPETLDVDYDAAERLTETFRPRLIVVGSAAYPRKLDYERLADIAHRHDAYLMADIAHFSGLVAAGLSPSPVPYADIVTASATKTMCGPHTGYVMCKKELADAVDKAIYPGTISSLHLQTIAATAYALENTKQESFREMMRQIIRNAQYLCTALEKRGFGIFTGGTDCHMFLADLRPLHSDATAFALNLEKIGITVNTKGIPFDDSGTVNGIRAGVTVLTQRGMKEPEMDEVADIWKMVAENPSETVLRQAQARVSRLARRFPLPG